MKITVEKSQLLDAAVPTAAFAANRSSIAATEGILLRAGSESSCDVCAYDLEKGIRTSFPCTVEEQGSAVINASRFIQIIKAMPDGPLTLTVDEKTLRTVIRAESARFELQSIPAGDFPEMPELQVDRLFAIRHCDLRDLIKKTEFAVADNHIRPELNGLYLIVKDRNITAVGCDGNRLSVYSKVCDIENIGSAPADFAIILPGKTVTELGRFIEDSEQTLKLRVARKHIMFYIGRFVIFTRLIDAEYIDYDRYIPKAPRIFLTVDAAQFTDSLERALLITEDRQQGQGRSPVVCTLKEGVLTVSSSSVTGRVSDDIPVEQEGEDLEIGFNCRVLHEAVRVLDGGKLKLSLTSPLMGMTIEPVGEDQSSRLLLLVLPVRMNK